MVEKLDCPNCGAPLESIQLGTPIVNCKYCHANVLLPTEVFNPIKTNINSTPGNILGHAQDLKRMIELARSGKQIEAILIFREVFDTSLTEAKRTIDAIAAGQPVVMPGASTEVTSSRLPDTRSISDQIWCIRLPNNLPLTFFCICL